MTKRELKRIKRFLPPGEQKKIAEKLGLSYSFVNKVLNNKRKSLSVLSEAIKISKSYEEKITGRAS